MSHRWRWVVLAGWLVIVGAAMPFAIKLGSVESNDFNELLPSGTQSSTAVKLDRHFPSGQSLSAVVVFRRPDGLTSADRARVLLDREAVQRARIPGVGDPSSPVSSPDGKAMLFEVPVVTNQSVLVSAVARIRELASAEPGVSVAVTGPAGFNSDVLNAFSGVDATLLVITAGLVALLLLLTYQSPVLFLIPLASVAFAEVLARAAVYWLARTGFTVTGEAASLLTVVVFGAGTDYALLLTARYREELRRHQDRRDAMELALRRAGPTVLASSATVVAALSCLLAAQNGITRQFGVVAAIGVASAALAGISAFPALLVATSRRVFWPRIPRFGSPDTTGRVWSRIARAVSRHPRRVWAAVGVTLAAMAVGLVTLNTSLTVLNDLPPSASSVQGEKLLAASFPGGLSAPVEVVVQDPATLAPLRSALARFPGVSSLGQVERAGSLARFEMVMSSIPSGPSGFRVVERIRALAARASGNTAVVGGQTAIDLDTARVSSRDDRVVIPLVLAVALVVLALVIRSLLGALVLVATVVLTFAAALGLGSAFFGHGLGYAGVDPTVPLLTFVFLVALGIDYNVFLVGRARQEVARSDPTTGMVTALGATGGVLTSAGLVLAGTFSVLAILPLVPSREIGVVVAVGVLLDTLVVRTLLVPALAIDLGGWFWWPSRASVRTGRTDRAEVARPS